jgi:hypothetical protein
VEGGEDEEGTGGGTQTQFCLKTTMCRQNF